MYECFKNMSASMGSNAHISNHAKKQQGIHTCTRADASKKSSKIRDSFRYFLYEYESA